MQGFPWTFTRNKCTFNYYYHFLYKIVVAAAVAAIFCLFSTLYPSHHCYFFNDATLMLFYFRGVCAKCAALGEHAHLKGASHSKGAQAYQWLRLNNNSVVAPSHHIIVVADIYTRRILREYTDYRGLVLTKVCAQTSTAIVTPYNCGRYLYQQARRHHLYLLSFPHSFEADLDFFIILFFQTTTMYDIQQHLSNNS